ncbi:MAG: S53 family peptidase [Actinomycetota bacterium]|nr:S53 family peptidase [Actinomycetota bacterium]
MGDKIRASRRGVKVRALAAFGVSTLAVGGLGAVSASSATATTAPNSTPIVYQVNPIAIQAKASLSVNGFDPAACIAAVGLACYGPSQFHAAYNVPWTINGQLAGTGEQVAIVDAYGSPTLASDLATYDAEFGLPPANLHVYYPDGKPAYNPRQHAGETGWAEETSLDVQTVHDLAPGATINLIVASSPNGNDLNVAERYAVDNHLGDVMSMSFGSPEAAIKGGGNNLQVAQADAIYKEAAAAGISVFASSGDSGASAGYATANASFPASDPNVTSTGGTDLFLNSSGGYGSEYTWNDSDPTTCPFGCQDGVFGATGGAPSSIFSAAPYQSAVSSMSARTTSDVSFNASVYTASMIYLGFLGAGQNSFYFFGGTSEASPAWAAIAADLDQAVVQGGGHTLGQLNSTLYGLASNPTSYASDFHNITVGNDQLPYPTAPGYSAGSGYNLPTGLGTPIVSGLLHSLAPTASLGFTQP